LSLRLALQIFSNVRPQVYLRYKVTIEGTFWGEFVP